MKIVYCTCHLPRYYKGVPGKKIAAALIALTLIFTGQAATAYLRAQETAQALNRPVCLYHCTEDGYTVIDIDHHEGYVTAHPGEAFLAIIAPPVFNAQG